MLSVRRSLMANITGHLGRLDHFDVLQPGGVVHQWRSCLCCHLPSGDDWLSVNVGLTFEKAGGPAGSVTT